VLPKIINNSSVFAGFTPSFSPFLLPSIVYLGVFVYGLLLIMLKMGGISGVDWGIFGQN